MTTLTTQILLDLPDTAVKSVVTSQFIAQLKCSPSLRFPVAGGDSIFFPDAPDAVNPKNPTFVDNLATAFVCSSIAMSSLYGFSATINRIAADNYWKTNLADTNANAIAEGQSLYGWAFPDYCKAGGVSFRNFMDDDPKGWAQKLSQFVTAAPYIDTTINEIFVEPGWLDQLNLTLYKINRLDPSVTAGVVDAWRNAYPQKNIVQNWSHRNFVPEADFNEVPDQFLSAVNVALASQGAAIEPESDTGVGGWSQAYYGFNVEIYFLGFEVPAGPGDSPGPEAPALRLGFTTGHAPQNLGKYTNDQGCFVAGTKVLLAKGTTVPIEYVKAGDVVVGQDGRTAIQSEEKVVLEMQRDIEIFGFDDGTTKGTPFFSAGHLFWTEDGWKAVDPEIALMENPDRTVGKLTEGDCVYQIKDGKPMSYDSVEIKAFTKSVLKKGERLYGMHLVDGPRSYHADGYLVAMNYPVLTIDRLIKGFRKLTPSELRYLEHELKPVMPLLNTAIGPFIQTAIQVALREAQVYKDTEEIKT